MSEDGYLLSLCRLTLLGISLSFFGWCFEMLGRYLAFGSSSDRGLLTLPLCPIYGIGLVCVYLLVGLPSSPSGIIGNKISATPRLGELILRPLPRFLLYFLFVTVFSSAVELITGLVAKAFGVTLWDYSQRPFNLFGVICLEFSLLWGVLITLFMTFLWRPAYRAVCSIGAYTVKRLAFSLVCAVCIDLAVTLILRTA